MLECLEALGLFFTPWSLNPTYISNMFKRLDVPASTLRGTGSEQIVSADRRMFLLLLSPHNSDCVEKKC